MNFSATAILEKVWNKYRPIFENNPMTLKIEGMGSFRNSVKLSFNLLALNNGNE